MLTFKEYLQEASILYGKYETGHKLELSKNALPYISDILGSGVFELADPTPDAEEIKPKKYSNEFIYLKKGAKVYKIYGSNSGINSSFNHHGAGGKSLTHKTTRAKEAASLIVFKQYQFNGSVISEDEMLAQFPNYDAELSVYNSKYYTSALLQLEVYKKLKHFNGKSLIFEFQGGKLSSQIYKKSKQLGGPSDPNNWNPADVWAFESGFATSVTSELNKIQSLTELNFWIRKSFLTGYMLPISLKASVGKAKIELINPLKYKHKQLEYDLTISRIIIAGSLKSVFIETVSGFTFKANARSQASNPTLYLEGTMKKENFSMGAIDAKKWQNYHNNTVLNGKSIKPTPELLNQSRDVFSMYKNLILKKENSILWEPNFDQMDTLLKQRYIAAASLLKFVMKDPEATMRWGFFSSMKINDDNSLYVKIS